VPRASAGPEQAVPLAQVLDVAQDLPSLKPASSETFTVLEQQLGLLAARLKLLQQELADVQQQMGGACQAQGQTPLQTPRGQQASPRAGQGSGERAASSSWQFQQARQLVAGTLEVGHSRGSCSGSGSLSPSGPLAALPPSARNRDGGSSSPLCGAGPAAAAALQRPEVEAGACVERARMAQLQRIYLAKLQQLLADVEPAVRARQAECQQARSKFRQVQAPQLPPAAHPSADSPQRAAPPSWGPQQAAGRPLAAGRHQVSPNSAGHPPARPQIHCRLLQGASRGRQLA
jgi:hypothetical protein